MLRLSGASQKTSFERIAFRVAESAHQATPPSPFATPFRGALSCADSTTRNTLKKVSKIASENAHQMAPKLHTFFAMHFVHAFLRHFARAQARRGG